MLVKCHYCDEPATANCLICGAPACDKHQHKVSRWHNVYHATWICEGCYQAKNNRRKYVLIPILIISAYFIAASMNVIWGISEPSMWLFFFAAAASAVVVFGMAAVYHIAARTGKAKKWMIYLIPSLVLSGLAYFIHNTLKG